MAEKTSNWPRKFEEKWARKLCSTQEKNQKKGKKMAFLSTFHFFGEKGFNGKKMSFDHDKRR